MHSRSSRGFTLIEMMIVLAVVGILAAIGIANYWNAMHRARQKRTMVDLKAVATAWESRATDMGVYNAAGFSFPGNAANAAAMTQLLSPTYIRGLPTLDGWAQPMDFGTSEAIGSLTPAHLYAVRSRGRDGQVDTAGAYTPGPTTRFDCDIIYSAGGFVAYPEGVTLE